MHAHKEAHGHANTHVEAHARTRTHTHTQGLQGVESVCGWEVRGGMAGPSAVPADAPITSRRHETVEEGWGGQARGRGGWVGPYGRG
jgi:hypothetical protein